MSFDVTTIGEAMLRLWVRPGSRLESTGSLRVAVAGAEANVAVALARMGRSVTWISRLPDSVLGRRVARGIAVHGVDVAQVRWVRGARLGAYYVELSDPPRPARILYDRACSAASELCVEDVPWDVVESAGALHLTGITPALSPSCREVTLEAARRARAASVPVSVDVNYRSSLWEPDDARKTLTELCSEATLVILGERDARQVFQLDGNPGRVVGEAQQLFAAEHVILTRGAQGSAWRLGDRAGETEAFQTRTVDPIGVGDAFAAGVLIGLLDGDMEQGIELGTAMAALKLGVEGDQFWSDAEEVEALLAGGGPEVRR